MTTAPRGCAAVSQVFNCNSVEWLSCVINPDPASLAVSRPLPAAPVKPVRTLSKETRRNILAYLLLFIFLFLCSALNTFHESNPSPTSNSAAMKLPVICTLIYTWPRPKYKQTETAVRMKCTPTPRQSLQAEACVLSVLLAVGAVPRSCVPPASPPDFFHTANLRGGGPSP